MKTFALVAVAFFITTCLPPGEAIAVGPAPVDRRDGIRAAAKPGPVALATIAHTSHVCALLLFGLASAGCAAVRWKSGQALGVCPQAGLAGLMIWLLGVFLGLEWVGLIGAIALTIAHIAECGLHLVSYVRVICGASPAKPTNKKADTKDFPDHAL